MATLRRNWETQLAKTIEQNAWIEDTRHRLNDQARLEANMKCEDKVEQRRLLRIMQMQAEEEAMVQNLSQKEQDKQIRERQRAQEERLAKEMEKIKLDALRDDKTRQQIRENSSELRELEAKLREAYVAKERIAQMAEKQALRYDLMAEEAEMQRVMREEHELAERLDREREATRAGSKVRYQIELEQQLEDQENRRQQAYQEFLKEKLMIDEIVRKIYEEDQRERELQLEKKRATQAYIHEFQRTREEWKIAERDRMELENRQILAYMARQAEREVAQAEEKKSRGQAMAKVQERLADEISRRNREREELEAIRQELVMEEQEAKLRADEAQSIERRIRGKLALQADHEEQLRYKQIKAEIEGDEEERYRQAMLAKFAEDDRLEQLNAQKRRLKQQEHKRAVESLLAARREQFERERAMQGEELAEAARREAMRRRIIEEERQKLLREHAHKLLGYLPRGVIQGDKDLELLGPEFQERYKKREIDPFADDQEEEPVRGPRKK